MGAGKVRRGRRASEARYRLAPGRSRLLRANRGGWRPGHRRDRRLPRVGGDDRLVERSHAAATNAPSCSSPSSVEQVWWPTDSARPRCRTDPRGFARDELELPPPATPSWAVAPVATRRSPSSHRLHSEIVRRTRTRRWRAATRAVLGGTGGVLPADRGSGRVVSIESCTRGAVGRTGSQAGLLDEISVAEEHYCSAVSSRVRGPQSRIERGGRAEAGARGRRECTARPGMVAALFRLAGWEERFPARNCSTVSTRYPGSRQRGVLSATLTMRVRPAQFIRDPRQAAIAGVIVLVGGHPSRSPPTVAGDRRRRLAPRAERDARRTPDRSRVSCRAMRHDPFRALAPVGVSPSASTTPPGAAPRRRVWYPAATAKRAVLERRPATVPVCRFPRLAAASATPAGAERASRGGRARAGGRRPALRAAIDLEDARGPDMISRRRESLRHSGIEAVTELRARRPGVLEKRNQALRRRRPIHGCSRDALSGRGRTRCCRSISSPRAARRPRAT